MELIERTPVLCKQGAPVRSRSRPPTHSRSSTYAATSSAVSCDFGIIGTTEAFSNTGRRNPWPTRSASSVLNEGDGRFAIVATHVKDEKGQDQAVTPILDAPISVPTGTRDGLATIHIILDAPTAKNQIQVVPGLLALNALHQTQVTVGGENIPARTPLLQMLSAAKVKLYWDLYYDHDVNRHAFSVLPLLRANYDASGNRTTALVR